MLLFQASWTAPRDEGIPYSIPNAGSQLIGWAGALRFEELLVHENLDQVTVANGEEMLARTRLRADSLLARISDEDFATGLAHLRADVEAGLLPGPIT
jgi:hypothetical protein